jgi:hypothetical protein
MEEQLVSLGLDVVVFLIMGLLANKKRVIICFSYKIQVTQAQV